MSRRRSRLRRRRSPHWASWRRQQSRCLRSHRTTRREARCASQGRPLGPRRLARCRRCPRLGGCMEPARRSGSRRREGRRCPPSTVVRCLRTPAGHADRRGKGKSRTDVERERRIRSYSADGGVNGVEPSELPAAVSIPLSVFRPSAAAGVELRPSPRHDLWL